MNSYGTLPVTGATITVGGIMLDQVWLLGAGFGALVIGVTMLRLTWRRGQSIAADQ